MRRMIPQNKIEILDKFNIDHTQEDVDAVVINDSILIPSTINEGNKILINPIKAEGDPAIVAQSSLLIGGGNNLNGLGTRDSGAGFSFYDGAIAGWIYDEENEHRCDFVIATNENNDIVISNDNGGGFKLISEQNKYIILQNLPTSDPHVAGALWNDNGTLKISSGN